MRVRGLLMTMLFGGLLVVSGCGGDNLALCDGCGTPTPTVTPTSTAITPTPSGPTPTQTSTPRL